MALCALTAKDLKQEFRSLKPLGETKKKKNWAIGQVKFQLSNL